MSTSTELSRGVCGKIAYPSKHDGQQEAARLRREDVQCGLKYTVSVYQCSVCPLGTWHVGRMYTGPGYTSKRYGRRH